MQIKKPFLFGGIAFFTILLIVCIALIPKGIAYVKQVRAQDHLEVSKQYLEKDLPKEAWQKAEIARNMDPDNPVIKRFMADIITEQNPMESIKVWEDLLSMDYDSTNDRLDFIQLLLRVGNVGKAENNLRIVEKEAGSKINENPKWIFVQATFDEKSGRINEAIAKLSKIIEMDGEMADQAKLQKIRLAISSQNSELFNEGRDLLNTLSAQKTDLGLKALRFYYRITGFSAEQAEDILDKTLGHPLSNRLDKMKAFAILHQSNPARADYCINKLREFFDLTNDEDIYQYAMWLGSLRRWDKVLDLLTFDRSAPSKKLFLLRMDALANMQKWDVIENEFSNRSVQVEPHWKRVFRGRAFSVMGDLKRAKIQWEQAHGATQYDPSKIMECCLYLEKIRELDGLGFLLRKLADYAEYEVFAIEKILSYEASKLPLPEMHGFVKRLARRKRDNIPLQNDLAYFNLLTGETINEATSNAQNNLEKSPGTLGFRVTYALGLYVQGKYSLALSLLDEPFINWTDARPAWRMIYAKILEKNNFPEKASDIISNIKLSSISRSESEGLQNL